MRPLFTTAIAIALLMLQGLLLPLGLGGIDVATRASLVPDISWPALGIYAVVVGLMGEWTFAGKRAFQELELGKRFLYASTIAATLPLWTLMNGFLDDDFTEMIPLWLVPFSGLIAGAAISKDWQDMVRAIVIGFGVPVASLLFLATFIDFGN